MGHLERIAIAAVMTVCSAGCTLNRPPSIAETAFLEQYARTDRFSLGRPKAIKITPDGSAVLFLRSGADSRVQDLFELDLATGKERRLCSADEILQGADEHLSVQERARRERMRLSARGVASYVLSDDGRRVLVPLSGRLFVIDRAEGGLTELHSDAGYPLDPRFSPDGQFVSCVRDGELFIIDITTGQERQLTTGAGGHVTHGLAEFVAQEEMDRRRGYWWSPDSQTIAYQRTDTTGLEVMHIADGAHPERAPQTWPYPRPGKKNAEVRIGLIPVQGGDTVWVNWDRERYPYLATVRWEQNAPLTVLVQNRHQTEEGLLAVDTATGDTSVLLVEKDDAWLNLDAKMPHWFPDGSAFLWTTERNGAWQLERRRRDGRLIAPLTSTDFVYKNFVHLDDDRNVVYVLGGDDPTQTHIYRVPVDGSQPPSSARRTRLTHKPGLHNAKFSKNHKVYLHATAALNGDRSQSIKRADGTQIARLRSVGPEPPFTPNIELTTAGDDPSFHAVLIRPRNFEATRRYPVIVNVYACPGHQMVQASANRYLLQQWIADHGCIVVSFDGRGTPSRGREWERIIKGNLIDVPLQDQVEALQDLGRRYRELDLGHVGIYGWSGGGYVSAMAAMRRPDVYHAAVAGAPVADFRDYDTHYTERYMGLPDENVDGYEAASVLTYAEDLTVPLLIIHGTADDNVYFMHSLKMSDALFRAGRPHDFLALSDFTHMVRDPLVTTRLYSRIMGFFEEHVLSRR